MFPSSGLFADQHCPFALRGLCERPHCLYKHAPEVLDAFGASCKSSIVEFAGLQNGRLYAACGAPVNNETKDDCHHELERINKEIETVRHEVEQERRRLSRYQTVQAESRNNTPVSTRETTGEGVDGLPPCTDDAKTRAGAKKYVVDNSKPRTDLEYDPLSNFSADLRSFSSLGKEQKVKIGKRDRKQTTTRQALLSQSPSPEPLDDSNEDDVLIIDVPLSPDQTRGRCASSQISGDTVKTPQHGSASRVDSNKTLNYSDSENNLVLSALNHNKECGNIAANQSVLDSTGCLVDTERECQKTTGIPLSEPVVVKVSEAACLPAASDCQDNSRSSSAEKMNQQQKTKNSPFYKGPAANSSQRQQAKQVEAPEQPAQTRVHSYRPPEQHSVPQKMSNKMSVYMEDRASVIHRSSAPRPEPAEPASGPSTHLSTRASSSSSSSSERLFMTVDNEPVIIVDSSSDEEEQQQQQDEELNYSDLELSDSDPMEECYRIFMEANNEEKGNEEQPNVSIVSVEKPEVNVTPKELPVKKRVAHEAKHTEQPVVKSRPQPQVLVPLRDPAGSGSRPSFPPKIQQVQQRASMLTASVKGGQVFVSSTCQKRPDTQSGLSAPAKPPEHLQPAPVQNAVNLIPLGTTVIDMGNNLHLILPEGTFPLPVTSTSSPITSVLTPITQVNNMGTFTVRPSHHPPTVIPMQRYHSTAPVLIPAPARKPSLTSAFASASLHSSPAASTTTQAAAKPVPVKRKLKQQCDAAKDKVPHNVRQRYVNMFTEEFLKTADNVNDAFTKALAEERTVFSRSVNKLKYLSVAVNALKRLKNQSAAAAKNENKVSSQRLKGNIPLNPKKLKTNDDVTLYECLKDYILTDEMLSEHNYPVQHPEKHGCAVLFADNKKVNTDPLKRICCRCGATYSVSQTGKHTRKEECNYHYGRGVTRRVPGGVETRYSCCEGVMGAPGCQVFKLHVHDSLSLDGFVSTVPRCLSDGSCPGVYALDCEMCYTINGLELSRVTVVSSSLEVVYDTFVKPDNEVIDYNTRFSGISEDDVEGNHTSLRVVQEILLSFISAGTVLIGHGLETDLCLLKLLHGTIVDTSVVFPHRLGPPHKLSLHHLTTEYLRRIIQESVCGHDTAEDAAACMELMLWKLKEDGKLKK